VASDEGLGVLWYLWPTSWFGWPAVGGRAWWGEDGYRIAKWSTLADLGGARWGEVRPVVT